MLQGRNIVAIDDTASIRSFIRVSLEHEGACVYEAANAKDGFQLCESIKPDIIVLDLGLPDIDGLDLLPKIQAIPDLQSQVIILSVRKGSETISEAYRRGASAYLTKPFMVDDLIETIQEHLPS